MPMRAMVLDTFGGTLKAETRPVPEPGPGEVLVRVVACGAGLTLESIRLGHSVDQHRASWEGTRYATRAEIARSLELVRDGKVKPVIGASFPLEQTEEAFEAIRQNRVFGRILIDCAG